jgi:hypothetical protein
MRRSRLKPTELVTWKRWFPLVPLMALLLIGCSKADEIARALETSTDDAARFIDDAERLGGSSDDLLKAIDGARPAVLDIQAVLATSALDDWIRENGDQVIVSTLCDVLSDAVIQGSIPEPGELVGALVTAVVIRVGEVPEAVDKAADIAGDLEDLYTAPATQVQAYGRILYLKYRYC